MRHVGARSVEIHLLGMRMCRVRDRSEGERGVASAVWSMRKKSAAAPSMGKESVGCRGKLREEEAGRGRRDDKVTESRATPAKPRKFQQIQV